ncbi:Teichoic acids export ATP-binding protein TagH [compost metagenome]|uniref:ABC transporter ATP-binding protein n=1 Tax=Raoultella TaxID=160674 RepID=UPI000F9898F7|nr:ABC transporter ATP-binding protein [Raoultella terrigena]MEB8192366.1 ABC transporter ATP-binding protein [Raoultella terrigena]
MSSNDYAIEVDNISKCYQVYDNPLRRLKDFIVPKIDQRLGRVARVYHDEFWALQDISFKLPRGQTIGVVGKNGSGKSTLLQILAGTLTPTSGEVRVNGRIAALLELGAGFNNDFSGRENVYLNASLLGLTKSEVDNRLDDILAFADIGHFIDSPVRSYSSGMLVRLAFAVQAQINPEILIVDEALAVGDAKFQAKCFARLKQLKANGTSILFVSHATEQIVTHCDRAILLNDGELVLEDSPRIVVNHYLDLLFGKSPKESAERASVSASIEQAAKGEQERLDREMEVEEQSQTVKESAWQYGEDGFIQRANYNNAEYRWGDRGAEIVDYHLVQGSEEYPTICKHGQLLRFKFRIKFTQLVVRPIFGFAIKTKEGITIYNTNTEYKDVNFADETKSNDEYIVSVEIPGVLSQGDYFISVGIASSDGVGNIIPHDRRYDSIHLAVEPTPDFIGLVDLGVKMNCTPM